jgi:5-methylcytosine-specific restriction endonuclease McrA
MFRSSWRWQKLRKQQIHRDPLCCNPFKYHEPLPALAVAVHHVIGLLECLRLGQLERLGCVPQNLRSICNDCHNKVEGIVDMQGEVAAKRLFITTEEEQAIIKLVLT